jgi:osmotically-inducible protein OsmY
MSQSSGAATSGSAAQAQSQIQSALMQQTNLSAVTVSAASDNSNAIQLSGSVSSEADRDQAKRIAQSVAPNVNIVDHIQVTGAPSGPSGAVGAATGAGVGAGVGAATSGSQTSTGSSTTGSSASGMPQSDQPPSASSQAGQTGSSTAGSTSQGGYGQSTTGGQTNPSTSSGAATQGGLATGGQTVGGSDLQSQIQTALKNESTLANSTINVNVSDTQIELTGTVPTGKEKQTAKRIAQSYAGDRKVVDHITVTGKGNASDTTTAQPPK